MTRAIAFLAALPLLLAAAPAPDAAPGPTAKTDHLQLTLAAETASAAPGSTVYVALRQKIMPEWHTYWRNPGDSGEPTTIKWTLPPGWKAGEIVWPAPGRARTGPLTNYVFSDSVWLPVPIEVPADAAPGKPMRVTAAAQWLVCKDVCVPEQATLAIDLPISAETPKPNGADGKAIADTLAAAPKPAGLKAAFVAKGAEVRLSVTGAPLKGAEARHAWFYPYDGTAIDPSKPQLVEHGEDGLTLTLPAGYAFTNGAPKTLVGVLALGAGQAWEVTAEPGAGLPGATGLSKAAPSTPDGGGHGATTAAGGATPAASGLGALFAAAGAAFVGGLILNLMPCVFPVLSIKAAQLVRHGGHPAAARAEGLAFLVGVVGTFVALAAMLLVLRAGGEAAGWGFQLQNPIVVAVLALLMLGVALNLSGVFEIGGSVQNVGSGLADKGGLVGALFTGALAVVVAAPCTAPFMAGAIGWAVTQPPASALLVFVFLGLGLAAPFTLVAFTPALARALPRPGAWMEGFRHVLAFPMYATAAWLVWVFTLQAGDFALPYLFAAAVVLAFAGWLWGVAQRGEAPLVPRLGAGAALLVAIPLVVLGAGQAAPPAAAASAPTATAPGALPTEPWSPARVAELQSQGRPIFVDFTAAWCVTCQVNERTALAGKGVSDAFTRTKAVYLKADWTKRDATIAQALTAHGRSGVPLYLVYGAGAEPKVLPQLLTEGLVVEALDAAAHPAA